jgi:hypothetical protein
MSKPIQPFPIEIADSKNFEVIEYNSAAPILQQAISAAEALALWVWSGDMGDKSVGRHG